MSTLIRPHLLHMYQQHLVILMTFSCFCIENLNKLVKLLQLVNNKIKSIRWWNPFFGLSRRDKKKKLVLTMEFKITRPIFGLKRVRWMRHILISFLSIYFTVNIVQMKILWDEAHNNLLHKPSNWSKHHVYRTLYDTMCGCHAIIILIACITSINFCYFPLASTSPT